MLKDTTNFILCMYVKKRGDLHKFIVFFIALQAFLWNGSSGKIWGLIVWQKQIYEKQYTTILYGFYCCSSILHLKRI